ncbi:hypothetical protein BDN72DRAFT_959686 [Pluteus cervinus]|uniref:Uncharacterized protein n=1 Tax=Pluteus cervinus TaxID=181527 RepID=A0ACD3AU98_9AGAR|nr:hypothetical protein BDN72DRAFT_959686 [Pluteus cervinus]
MSGDSQAPGYQIKAQSPQVLDQPTCSMALPSVPFEVWSQIFELSCADGGDTGLSLSRVSRSFNRLSVSYKFHSVLLRSGNCVFRFLPVLKNTPPELRCVKYLYAAHEGILSKEVCNPSQEPKPVPEGEELEEGDAEPDTLDDVNSPESCKLLFETLHTILEICSETLIHLSVNFRDMNYQILFGVSILPTIFMPYLQELTWCFDPYGGWLRSYDQDFTPRCEGPVALFPSLSHLHFGQIVSTTTGKVIEYHCPKLFYFRTKLPCYGFTCSSGTIWRLQGGTDIYTPSSVIEHLLEVDPDEWIQDAGDESPKYLMYKSRKQTRLKELEDPRRKLAYSRTSDIDQMEEDWRDRISGVSGGWGYEKCYWSGGWNGDTPRAKDWTTSEDESD